jgi:long-chain acyl-CoA synthetase
MPFVLEPTFSATVLKRARRTPNQVAFAYRSSHPDEGMQSRRWQTLTFVKFLDECRTVSFGLMASGLFSGQRVAFLTSPRIESLICEIAVLGANAVPMPVDPELRIDERNALLKSMLCDWVIVENAALAESLQEFSNVIVLEPAGLVAKQIPAVPFGKIQERGRDPQWTQSEKAKLFEAHLEKAKETDLAAILFTAGVSGAPKAVPITQGQAMAVLNGCVRMLSTVIRPESDVIQSFLSQSQILGRIEFMATFVFGWKHCLSGPGERFVADLPEVRPTLFFGVPRTFLRLTSAIEEKIEVQNLARRGLIRKLLAVAEKIEATRQAGQKLSLAARAELLFARRAVFPRISKILGGRLKLAISGGAPIPSRILQLAQALGIQILEGYGLTEACGPVTLNPPAHPRSGTVGCPLPGVAVRIDPSGEILVKGPQVFSGYLGEDSPQTLNQPLNPTFNEDGWLKTGDLGKLDEKGYLHLRGRKTDLLVLSDGRRVAPQRIETLARTLSPWIGDLLVVGDRQDYLSALVSLKTTEIIRYGTENQILFSQYPELLKNPKIQSLAQRAIDQLNERLPAHQAIRKFILVPQEFSVGSGELAPTQELRRNLISEKYAREIEALYTS